MSEQTILGFKGHSPLPWTIKEEDYGDEWWFGGEGAGQFIVKDNKGVNVAVYGLYKGDGDDDADARGEKGNRANAKLIVAAVNAYPLLDEMAAELEYEHGDVQWCEKADCDACRLLTRYHEAKR